MKLKWFAVKSLYRSAPVGRPTKPDADYDPGGSLVEERVFVFRAGSHAQAIAQAELEAKRYAKPAHRNAYGQKVVMRYLGQCDSYEMFDSLRKGAEVFSETYRIPLRVSDVEVADRFLGTVDDNERRLRKQYLDAEIMALAQVRAEARQLATRAARRDPASRGLQRKPRATGGAR